jgi:Domain of unknown function (DUF4268)
MPNAGGSKVPIEVGKLQRVALREVWKHEAADFTRWLRENIEVLGEAIDLTLGEAETERAAGEFNVDVVAEDESGGLVVIENQLERSDHDHLGKLLTYLVMVGASRAVWVVAEPRPEHARTIAWLNESSSAEFFLVKVEAVRIGGSSAAPLFTLIVGPSEDTQELGEAKREWAERHHVRHKFWQGLLEYARSKTPLHANRSPGRDNWISGSSGKAGLSYNYVIRGHQTGVELYIDFGKSRDSENKAFFDALQERKAEIERTFGDSLEWQRLDSRRACRIRKTIDGTGYKDEESRWPEAQKEMTDAMIRLERALRPELARLAD